MAARAWRWSPAATRAAEYGTYAAMAQEFGLAASRGSDFHSPDESHTDIGTLPGLPAHLTPVWELLDHPA